MKKAVPYNEKFKSIQRYAIHKVESPKKNCVKCGKKLNFWTIVKAQDISDNEVTLCEKCYSQFKIELEKQRESINEKEELKRSKLEVKNITKEFIEYYCANCQARVKYDDIRCPNCHSLLAREGAVYSKKIERNLINESTNRPSGIIANKVLKRVRMRGHGIMKKYCPVCNKQTDQEILEQRPLNWILIGFIIPIPYNSKKYNIWYKCHKCGFVVGSDEEPEVKEEILERYPETTGFRREEVKMQINVCDVCFFEENKRMTLVKWEQKVGNIVLHLCDKHKNWLENQKRKGKFSTQKELMNHISKWYEDN
jgi:DNA-directed RNA polymerase subunit RPC12/RpoP